MLVPVTIFLIRHGKAGSRREWDGDDSLRPLSRPGVAQAQGLVPLLRAAGQARRTAALWRELLAAARAELREAFGDMIEALRAQM